MCGCAVVRLRVCVVALCVLCDRVFVLFCLFDRLSWWSVVCVIGRVLVYPV